MHHAGPPNGLVLPESVLEHGYSRREATPCKCRRFVSRSGFAGSEGVPPNTNGSETLSNGLRLQPANCHRLGTSGTSAEYIEGPNRTSGLARKRRVPCSGSHSVPQLLPCMLA